MSVDQADPRNDTWYKIMLAPSDYLRVLSDSGITFFTGILDSLLKEFCACITTTMRQQDNVVAANEGASVGGQPTVGFNVDMRQIASACGYVTAQDAIDVASTFEGVNFIEAQVRQGNRADIDRPTSTPTQNKIVMMNFLREENTTHG